MVEDNADTPSDIGRRLQELRSWRRLSLAAVAEQAGFSRQYLSMIERGERPVDRRSTLEALAQALRVSPAELTTAPVLGRFVNPEVEAAHSTIAGIDAALSDVGFGDVAATERPWPQVAAELRRFNDVLRPSTDYAGQGRALPGLITDLQALLSDPGAPRRDVLVGLIECYHSAVVVTRNLGVRGLPALAAWHARRTAEELDDPAWLGLAAWLRSSSMVGGDRERMRAVALRGIVDLEPHLGDPRARQMAGALHLQTSMAVAARREPGAAAEHLDAADEMARSLEVADHPDRGFGSLYFGPDNVRIWRLSIAVELGESGRARELARGVRIARVPSAARQAVYWSDLGRGLAARKADTEESVRALRRAEDIAPVYVRTRPLIRETVTHLLHLVGRDDTAGRELRGMAYRMGIAG